MEIIEQTLGEFEVYRDRPIEFISDCLRIKLNIHQTDIIEQMRNNKELWIPDNRRQMGYTTAFLAYSLYRVLFCREDVIFFTSTTYSSRNNLQTIRSILFHALPEFLDYVIASRDVCAPTSHIVLNNKSIVFELISKNLRGLQYDAYVIADALEKGRSVLIDNLLYSIRSKNYCFLVDK